VSELVRLGVEILVACLVGAAVYLSFVVVASALEKVVLAVERRLFDDLPS